MQETSTLPQCQEGTCKTGLGLALGKTERDFKLNLVVSPSNIPNLLSSVTTVTMPPNSHGIKRLSLSSSMNGSLHI